MPSRLQSGLVAQFHRPSGALGHVAGWVMSRRASNVDRNEWTVSLLDIQPEDHVLEIGFGPGLAVARAAQRALHGRVVGIDHSEVMWRQASRRNRAAIRRGLVELRRAGVSELAQIEGRFDKIFTVNCLMFWPDPKQTLSTLCARLEPGGVLAVTHQTRKPGATESDVTSAEEGIRAQLESAGLELLRCERLPLAPVAASCLLAKRRHR